MNMGFMIPFSSICGAEKAQTNRKQYLHETTGSQLIRNFARAFHDFPGFLGIIDILPQQVVVTLHAPPANTQGPKVVHSLSVLRVKLQERRSFYFLKAPA